MSTMVKEGRRLDSRIRRAALLAQLAEAVAVATRTESEARMLAAAASRPGGGR